MYLIKTPKLIRNLFPHFTWRLPPEERTVYLTFDDGPVPAITPWILDQLAARDVRASFFCVGQNIDQHPAIFQRIRREGHTIGNHTYHHLDGWRTDNLQYFHDVRRCAVITQSTLFRPPYGRLTPRQIQFLHRRYSIIMWDVLSADFDPAVSAEECLLNVTDNVEPGSIVVLHDSLKSADKVKYVLPRLLDYLQQEGYQLAGLPVAQAAHAPVLNPAL